MHVSPAHFLKAVRSMASRNKGREDKVTLTARENRCRELHDQGLSWDEVAKETGYRSAQGALSAATRAVERDPIRNRAQRRQIEDDRLEWLIDETMKHYARIHPVVSNSGKIVYHEDGTMVDDVHPKLDAIRTIKGLSESRRKLLGLDARKIIEIISAETVESEIRRLEAELASNDQLALQHSSR